MTSIALARAVYPDAPWQFDTMHGIVYDGRDGTQFDPRNNPAQAWEVMAWLLQNDDEAEINFCQVVYHAEFRNDGYLLSDHDGTALSLVRAVVTAAERVVGEVPE